MKPMSWDRILAMLGVIFTVAAWVLPEISIMVKVGATIAVVWITLTIYLVMSDHLTVAWPLFSGGLVATVGILGYLRLSALQLPQTSRMVILSLVLLLLLGILILASQKSRSLPLRALVILAPPDSLEQFEPFVEDAKEIFLCGLTLGGLVSRCGCAVEHLVSNQGCRVRVILPQEDVILSSAHRISLGYEHGTRLKEEYQATLAWLDQLAKHRRDKVEVRIAKTLPTVSLMIADPDSPRARLGVSLHVFGGALNKRPYFELSKHEHPKWYDFFAQRYCRDLWDRSEPREVGARAELKRAQERLRKRSKSDEGVSHAIKS